MMVRDVASRTLRENGYEIIEASNGTDALRLCDSFSRPIHLILTDIVMPGLSGPEMAAQLKRTRPETGTLFMSGYMRETVLRHGLQTDSAFLQKPFSPELLIEKVQEVLRSDTD